MGFQYYIINVFSDVGIDGGNQLAVFPNAGKMTLEDMQQITKQFNFSESTFVTDHSDKGADVRIFTPGKEIMYAGHPTIGTLNVMENIYRKNTGKTRENYSLNLQGGHVVGTYSDTDRGDIEITSFVQVSADFIENFDNRKLILELLGINESDLADNKPFQINMGTAMRFLFIQVKDAEILANLNPNFSELSKGIFKKQDLCAYVFTTNARDGGDVRARFFVPLYGIPEDPATGGVQSSFGLCLNNLGLLKNDSVNEIVVEQGYEMGRPSKIYNKFHVKENKLVKTETGGRCFYFAEGELM
ncbi:MAG: PhzF family phenazine biosynthesis protein [Candidatus Heimdallarchaeota archaeon]|nr:PhzF family phenazine biosynthesis protein [Candidatus Heimdallarchaeota archaeon]